MVIMFLGTSTLQTEANKRCDEFSVCLKGQEARGDPVQHCLGKENLTVDTLYHLFCWEHSHICSEAAHMLAPFPSVGDSEPVPSECPEISQTNSSLARRYSYEGLGLQFSAQGRTEKTLGRISIP